MTIEITVFAKRNGPLTKRISLDTNGKPNSNGAACVMAHGTARRAPITDVHEFAALIGGFASNEALALGMLREGLPDQVRVVTKEELNGGDNVIARTGADIVFAGRPAFALFDYDQKAMPLNVAERVKQLGGFWNVLVTIVPALSGVARVIRTSTSAGLLRTDTGESIPGSGGAHGYILVKDGTDIPRFLDTLHARCWLAGFGWIMLGEAGQFLKRAIVDRSVGAPERLVFEGPPILVPPLAQDAEARRPMPIDGEALDTLEACPPLTKAQQKELNALYAAAEKRMAGEQARVRREYISKRAQQLIKDGMSPEHARNVIESQCRGVLLPELALPFDDPELAGATVAAVLANPARFEGETLADPIEGPAYGHCKAKVMLRADGTPWINSYAHGGATYILQSKPELIVNPQNLSETAKNLAALIAAKNEFLFNGNYPVRIAAEAGHPPKAIEVTTGAVRHYALEICTPVMFEKTDEGWARRPVMLSIDVANLYLDLEGRWSLRPFHGITSSPILTADGGIRTAHGYDEATGLWCHNVPEVDIPERPTEEQAKDALLTLRRAFRTFPFADGERKEENKIQVTNLENPAGINESAFLVALLTAVCRQCLELAPGLLVNAPNLSGSGTGKGLLVRAICINATGAPPSAFTSGHDKEELEKRLTAGLIEARSCLFLDNFNAKELRSDTLASALTENPCEVRIFGQTKNVKLHVTTFIAITGNGVQTAEDMARRLLQCDLDARVPDPEKREFEPGFLDQIYNDRVKLLTAALTIWRWGRQHTSLKRGQPLGSFEVWARWCRHPLLALGCKDPVSKLAEIKANDPKRRAATEIFDAWQDAHGSTCIKASDLSDSVIMLIDRRAIQKPKGDGSGETTLHYSRQHVASWLARNGNTRVGPYHLKLTIGGPPSKPTAEYSLEKMEEPDAKKV
jgi:hypothetical protein